MPKYNGLFTITITINNLEITLKEKCSPILTMEVPVFHDSFIIK